MSRTFHHRREERKPKKDRRPGRDEARRVAADAEPIKPHTLPSTATRLLARGIVNGYLYLLDEALLAPSQHLLVFEHELSARELERRILIARRKDRRRVPLAMETLLELGCRRVVPTVCWRREGKGWVVDAPGTTDGWFAASQRLAGEEAWFDGYILAVDAGLRQPGFDYYVLAEPMDAGTARNVFVESLAMLTAAEHDEAPPTRSRARGLAEQIGRRIVSLGGYAATARVSISVGRDHQVDCEDYVRLGVGAELDFIELADQYTPQRYARNRW